MPSAGTIIKHLISKHGPMTTNTLATHISTFEKELVSKSHLKKHVLASMEGEGTLYKQVYRDTTDSKPVWRWQFTDESQAVRHKELK